MTETGCKNLYGTCSFSVTTIVGTMLASFWAFAPASAQSESTFAVFQARCMTPMSQFDALTGTGLLAAPSNRDTLSRWWVARHAGEQTIVAFDSAPQGGRRSCELETSDAAIRGLFEDWINQEIDAGVFEPDSEDRWLSLEWAEPRLAVELDRSDTVTTLRVIETNLES